MAGAPTVLIDMLTDPDGEKSQRAMAAILQMKKPDIDTLKRAYAGIQYSDRRAYFRLFTASSSLADWHPPEANGVFRHSRFRSIA